MYCCDTYWCNFDFVFMFLGGRKVPADIVSDRSDFSSPWTSSATDAAASGQGSRSQRRLDGHCLAARQHADAAKILNDLLSEILLSLQSIRNVLFFTPFLLKRFCKPSNFSQYFSR